MPPAPSRCLCAGAKVKARPVRVFMPPTSTSLRLSTSSLDSAPRACHAAALHRFNFQVPMCLMCPEVDIKV